jgi:hypothetical protein
MKYKVINKLLNNEFHNTLLSYLNIQLIINDKYINNIIKRVNKDNIIYIIVNDLKGKYIKHKENNILNELKIIGEKHYIFLPKNNFNNNKDDNLLITNTKYALDINKDFNSITMYKYLDKSNKLYSTFKEDIFNSTLINNKYKNITIILIESASFLFYSIYHYTLTYYIVYTIMFALKCLKKGGNLLVKFPLFKNNSVLEKLLQLLYSKFEKFDIEFVNEFFYINQVYINVKGFKGLNDKEIELYTQLGNEALNYKLTIRDIFNYKYYHDTVECKDDKPGKMYFKFNKVSGLRVTKPDDLNIITDIEEFSKPSRFIEGIVKRIEMYYELYINEYEYNIARLLTNKNEIADKEQFNEYKKSLIYPYIERIIYRLERENIPYNKSYLKVIDKYYEDNIEKLYALENKQTLRIVKHTDGPKKLIIKPKIEGYNVSNKLNKVIDKLENQLFIKNQLLTKLGLDKEPYNIKVLFEGLTRGVARYIKENFELQYEISNGFVKLWEIYNTDPRILPIVKKENINVFHMAEAPGQWINATDHYIYNTLVDNKDETHVKYNWYANALNPYNPKNIKLYGKDLFKDNYGFIGKYQDRWLYGEDDTGDLTRSSTIKWMRTFLHDKYGEDKPIGPLKLVTGDAGINSDASLTVIQKIDLAQAITVLACSMKGGNCIIKHFLPFIPSYPDSRDSTSLYVNIMYLYYSCFKSVKFIKPKTSNPVSGEFYVVGMDFQGVGDSQLEKLYVHLDNMNQNECFIRESDLPDKFIKQVVQFFITLNEFNIEQKDLRLDLLNCSIELKNNKQSSDYVKKMNCRNYTSRMWIDKFIENKVEAWIDDNNFK